MEYDRDKKGKFVKGHKQSNTGRTLCKECHLKTETYGMKAIKLKWKQQ